MMKQQRTLGELSFARLNSAELRLINGGDADGLPPWLKKLGPAAIATLIIDNWKDIKAGAVDGWNSLK